MCVWCKFQPSLLHSLSHKCSLEMYESLTLPLTYELNSIKILINEEKLRIPNLEGGNEKLVHHFSQKGMAIHR